MGQDPGKTCEQREETEVQGSLAWKGAGTAGYGPCHMCL